MKGSNAPGGKEATASKTVRQLELYREPADSPSGNAVSAEVGRPTRARPAVPLSRTTDSPTAPAMTMTMEEIANQRNLLRAFERVAENKGAPGADGRSIDQVRDILPRLLPKLHKALLDGSYRPGKIRRVWIPKPGGGRRGLGIPNVVDRMVQQAVLQVLSAYSTHRDHPFQSIAITRRVSSEQSDAGRLFSCRYCRCFSYAFFRVWRRDGPVSSRR